jgi:hypothetical protein
MAVAVAIDPEIIMEMAQVMREAPGTKEQKQAAFKKEYPVFAKDYPMLFDMCCTPDFDMGMLSYMLNMLATSGSKEAASVHVGQKLFDTFVDPVLPGASKKK